MPEPKKQLRKTAGFGGFTQSGTWIPFWKLRGHVNGIWFRALPKDCHSFVFPNQRRHSTPPSRNLSQQFFDLPERLVVLDDVIKRAFGNRLQRYAVVLLGRQHYYFLVGVGGFDAFENFHTVEGAGYRGIEVIIEYDHVGALAELVEAGFAGAEGGNIIKIERFEVIGQHGEKHIVVVYQKQFLFSGGHCHFVLRAR